MGIPILTSEGFVGQRWIIDDYFRAGETLYAGNVVEVREDSSGVAKVYKLDTAGAVRKTIGIVHTPAGKRAGEEMASSGNYVPIVTSGIAKATCSVAIDIGDPVTPAGDSSARVKEATGQNPVIGRSMTDTSISNRVIDVLLDIASSVEGAPGPKGDTGDRGPQGPRGLTGSKGNTGDQGPQGPRGLTGSKGDKGDTGSRGATGAAGPRGWQGAKGDKGDTGSRGATGAAGPRGWQGAKGDSGSTGPRGPQGATGPRGPQGPQGPQGPRGPRGPRGYSGGSDGGTPEG